MIGVGRRGCMPHNLRGPGGPAHRRPSLPQLPLFQPGGWTGQVRAGGRQGSLRGVREGCRPLGQRHRKQGLARGARALGRPLTPRRRGGAVKSRSGRLGVGALPLLSEDVTGLTGTLPATMPTSSSTPSGNTRTRPPGETSEARIAKDLADPLRARILQRLGERVASPVDLSVELGAPLGVVSYHVRMLRDYDCVELVRTEPRCGALQHFYRAIAGPNLDAEQWLTLPAGLRQQ